MPRFIVCALTGVLASTPVWAAVTVIGGGQAQACYKAADAGKFDSASLAVCDMALDTEILDARDRGGTLVNRGVMKLRRGDYLAAQADFDAGIKLAGNVGEGFANRGAAYIAQKRYKEAVEDIDKALQLGVKEPAKAYYNRALAFEGMDDEKSAYLDYQQALVLAPSWPLPAKELERFTVTRR